MSRRWVTVAIGVAVVVGIGAFLTFSHSTSMPIQITYKGVSYGTMVPDVNTVQTEAHGEPLHRVHDTIDGKAVWISPGSPPRVVALEISPGEWDAYQLSASG